MRYHKFCLAEAPILLSTGLYSADREVTEWSQPPDRWGMLHLWHGGILHVNGVPHPFTPGTRFVISPRSRCRLERTSEEDTYQFWTYFAPLETKVGEMAVPIQSSFEDRLESLKRDAATALDLFAYNKGFVRALVWALLWSVAEEPSRFRSSIVIERAEELIEAGIGGKLRVQDLATELMVSHNHLTRQFVRELGVTPQEYIRNLRLNIAVRLLTTTTTPIKRIAVRVGVPDLKQFNRLVKDRLGHPPRAVRDSRRTLDANLDLYQRRESQEGS